jgi:uncharacterized protein YpuA (DUF1002 family)
MEAYMKKKKTTRIVCGILAAVMIISLLASTIVTAFADEVKVVTLGADLSDEQRELILNYFNVSESEVEIVTVTNEEEHAYLDGIATQQQIGKHTYSCSYVEPTSEGGIHIKTANLNWVTCEMIRNALITSGITNCNVICAAPIEVSGTGALTGIFKAYDTIEGEDLDEEKVALASEELVQTMSLAESIGQEEATDLMSNIKEEVITEGISSEDDIKASLEEYCENNQIELTDEQIDALIQLLLDISKQEYSVEEVKQAYADVKEKVTEVKEAAEEAKNIFQKIADWFVTMWQKITGKYEEVKESEEAQMLKDQLGILANTNDSLLGDSTVVTVTEDQEVLDQIDENTTETTDTDSSTAEKESIFDKIANFFAKLFGGDRAKSDETSTEVKSTETTEAGSDKTEIETEKSTEVTFDSVSTDNVEDDSEHDCQDYLVFDEDDDSVFVDSNGVKWQYAKCSYCEKEYYTKDGVIATDEEVEERNNDTLSLITYETQNSDSSEAETESETSGTTSFDDLTK